MVPMSVIEEFAKKVGETFGPEKIILFGSYAYGQPHEDSDVDLLLIYADEKMPRQPLRVRSTLHPGFPLDVIIRSESEIDRRLSFNDSFVSEMIERGKVLYDA
jgi:uncharacterized protein